MMPSTPKLFDAISTTWPTARNVPCGSWLLREGRGGGKRVSSAVAQPGWRVDTICEAEDGMQAMGQTPLFMIRHGIGETTEHSDVALDHALAQRGYDILDPTLLLASPLGPLTTKVRSGDLANVWPPLAIQSEIWSQGGIGAASQNIMARATGPKTALFIRHGQKAAGTGFVALHENIAMLHALEVLCTFRRNGLGRCLVEHAAVWAQEQGATHLALLVVSSNAAAKNLYASMGFQTVGAYHYRIQREIEVRAG